MCCVYSVEQSMICFEASKMTAEIFGGLFKLNLEHHEDHIRRAIYGVVALLEEPHKLPPVSHA